MAIDEKTSNKDGDTSQPYSIYSRFEKAFLITLISLAATFSGFASNIYCRSILIMIWFSEFLN